MLEIYNETLTDLLHDLGQVENAAGVIPDAPKLTIVDLPTGVSVPALFLMPLASEEVCILSFSCHFFNDKSWLMVIGCIFFVV